MDIDWKHVIVLFVPFKEASWRFFSNETKSWNRKKMKKASKTKKFLKNYGQIKKIELILES